MSHRRGDGRFVDGGQVPGVLRAKLGPPRGRPDALPRTEAVQRLAELAVPGRVVLVVAGAGWGKSTLAASWLARRPRGAWLSVDPGDDDPRRFFAHLLAAVAAAGAGTARAAALFAAPGTDVVGDLVPALLDDLEHVDDLALVLDDHHAVTNAEVHRGLALLVEHLPAALRLVLVGRAAPPLPVARLRSQGRLADLGPEQLRLSPAETAELLRRETDLAWAPGDVELLHARTEGWVTGLHLAALSLRRQPRDPAVFAERFAGDDPHVADYVLAEVVDHLPAGLRQLLRRIAPLERFCAPLAAAVADRPDAAALLARAEHEQLFLIPLDDHLPLDDGGWYRFHHLFTPVLRRDLERTEADLLPALHRRAARWLADHGHAADAVPHALAGDDAALAAELVAEHGPGLARQGQIDTALGWFRMLGDDVCRSNAMLCVARVATAGYGARVEEMVRWADIALEAAGRGGLPEALGRLVEGMAAIARWTAASAAGDTASAVRHAEHLAALTAGGPAAGEVGALTTCGVAWHRAGRSAEAREALGRAAVLAGEVGDDLSVLTATGWGALIAAVEGRPYEAERFAALAEERSARPNLREHFNAHVHHLVRGWLALQAGAPGRARAALQRASQLVRRSPLRVSTAEVLAALALAEDQLGFTASAAARRAEACELLASCPDPGRLLVDPREPTTAPDPAPAGLSPREIDVLRLVADGLTNREVAEQLGLSTRTVEAHLRAIFRKTGVRTRGAAVRYALENGLTEGGGAR